MQQVLLNLVVNARDAMPDGGALTIATSLTTVERLAAHGGPDVAPGRLRGARGDRHRRAAWTRRRRTRIFEPFFTTKAFGQGTGLGLSTVYGIAKQSGGDVQVQSTPGRGATFRVLLPAAPDPSARRRRQPEPAPAPGHARRAARSCWSEDDEGVRDFAARCCARPG